MLKSNLDKLYGDLTLIVKDLEFAKLNFINSVRIGSSNARKILVEKLGQKCDELKNQDLEILKFIYELLECEDESDLETLLSGEK